MSNEHASMLIRKIDLNEELKVINKNSAPRMDLKPIINHSVCNDQTEI